MSFTASIQSCFSNYVTFTGRAPRSEFWWFQVFMFLAGSALVFTGPGVFLAAALILPAWAVGTRRLHDINKSGWNFLWYAIPVLGLILFLIWNTRRGTEGANDYGANPINESTTSTGMRNISAVADKAEQLARIKVLLESGTINQAEFDRMKAELLGG